MEQWANVKPTGVCASSGRELAEGEEYYAVLLEEGESFRRADYSLEAWAGPPPEAYCFFKTRVPVRQTTKKRLFVDDEMLVNFFIRLGNESDAARLRFRFVLTLILMRKRILRYEQTVREGGAEYWEMRQAKEHSIHRVLNPLLTDDQIEEISEQLGAILHGDSWCGQGDGPGATAEPTCEDTDA